MTCGTEDDKPTLRGEYDHDIEECRRVIAGLRTNLQEVQEKLANWEPWMSALGRMLTEHRIARFPDDVLAWREELEAVGALAEWRGEELTAAAASFKHRDKGWCAHCSYKAAVEATPVEALMRQKEKGDGE